MIGPHDLGSQRVESSGTLHEKGDRIHTFWERQVHATAMLLVKKGHLKVDEVRRGIEFLEPDFYASASYYEKWACSICNALLEHQLLGHTELGIELGPEEDATQRFSPGDLVRVRPSSAAVRWRRPHLRTPGFVHGVCGVVERFVGLFANPEQLAFGGKSWTKNPLYIVRFDVKSIRDFDVGDHGDDQVTVEVYQPWLETASPAELEQQKKKRPPAELSGHADCKRAKHEHEGHDHVHEERATVEQRALEQEPPCPAIARALNALLLKKGIISAEELRAGIERVDEGDRNRGAAGRQVVARAWVEPRQGWQRRGCTCCQEEKQHGTAKVPLHRQAFSMSDSATEGIQAPIDCFCVPSKSPSVEAVAYHIWYSRAEMAQWEQMCCRLLSMIGP
ncbi:unnamed protein product [Effrenium voratum]|nr:unnamed protein product [Effrenium voratum]